MKALVIRPGLCEIPEEVIKNSSRHPILECMRVPRLWKIGVYMSTIRSVGAIAVSHKLSTLGVETDATEAMFEFGIAITKKGIELQNTEFKNKLLKGKYDLICISCTTCQEYRAVKRLCAVTKQTLPHGRIIVGGYHPSCDTKHMMHTIPEIDIIVFSDFEPVAEQLITAIKNNTGLDSIPNLIYRKNGNIICTERKFYKIDFNRDVGDYSDNPFNRFLSLYSLHSIEGSRGCPYHKCTFCQEAVLRKYRSSRPVEQLVNEMEYITNAVAKYHGNNAVAVMGFTDPVWGLSREWIINFCNLIKQRKNRFDAGLRWAVDTRLDQNIKDLYPLMHEAGCRDIAVGVESFSPNMLNKMKKSNKEINPDEFYNKVKDTLKAASDLGWNAAYSLLLGWPGEELKDILCTFDKVSQMKKEIGNKVTTSFYGVTPLPGTELWEMMQDHEFCKKNHTSMEIDMRFWEKGYYPYVPLINPSRTLSAAAISNFATHKFQSTIKKTEGISRWVIDTSFQEKLFKNDMITKDDIGYYLELIRKDFMEIGQSGFFELFALK